MSPPERLDMRSDSRPSSRSREWLFRLVLLMGSLLFAFAMGEIAIRLLLPEPGEASHPEEGDGFSFFAHHEQLGWDLVPDTADRHHSDEFDVTLRISAQGLRSDRIYPLERTPGVARVVVLGDSFTFGHGVEVEDAYPARLEALLEPTEALNLGVTGYGVDQQLLRFLDQGVRWRPDVVLLGLFEGDIFRNVRRVHLGYAKPRFVLRSHQLELTGVPVPRSPDGPKAGPSRLLTLLRGPARDLQEHLGLGEAWPLSEAIFARLAEVCEQQEARLLVALIPKDQAVLGQGPRRRLHLHTLGLLENLLESQGIDVLDLTPVLREAVGDKPLYYPQDGHWTPEGHRVASLAIARHMIDSGLIPAPRAPGEQKSES